MIGALLGGVAVLGGVAWAVVGTASAPRTPPRSTPPPRAPEPLWTEQDVEAAARMLASENPRGPRALHIEQIWTQLRARKPGQSLYDRITAGSGYGPQGERTPPGRLRPVSTDQPATDAQRQLAREVLAGLHDSGLVGAKKFFEPAQQDLAFAQAERARKKRAAGEPLTPKETRLLGYRRTADAVRREWLAEGARFIGRIEGVEFFS
ncbi:MAG: hypothetical protein U1A78_00130 [Polyangia bacterium]